LEVDPKIIARQLALIDSELFKKITRSEFASIAWTKPDKQIKTPNIVEMTLHFNQVSLWVSREILSSASTKKRFLKICHFIAVAQVNEKKEENLKRKKRKKEDNLKLIQ